MDEYVQAVMRRAVYEVDSDGSAYGSVTVTSDLVISASAQTQRHCKRALQQNVRHAVETALHDSRALPSIDGVAPPRSIGYAA